jgi:two-component system heavy metal sensor histidine kinase CusS
MSRFSADIAHELRTPLQILRSEAEMSLSRERSPAEYRQCLESGLDEYARLSRMVDALLFLARAEQADARLQASGSARRIAICLPFFQAMADEQDMTLNVQASGRLWADQGLCGAPANLVDNALRNTGKGGSVTLSAVVQQSGDVEVQRQRFRFGIAPEDLPILPSAFTLRIAPGSAAVGSGLGLAIVQSIMRLHGGTIDCQHPRSGYRSASAFPACDTSGHHAAI